MPELKEIVSESPDSLGVCLDFGHANLQRPLFRLRDAIRELESGLIATHIHDNEGRSDQHMLPLMGNIPWDEAIAAAGISFANGLYAVIQLETPGAMVWAYGTVIDNASGDPTALEMAIVE